MFVLLLPFSIAVVYAWCTGPVPMWRCRGHISHFAQLPRGISPTRCLLGPTAGELLPKIHHPAFLPLPHHATHPPPGSGVSRAPSVHPVYATATSLSQKQGKVHEGAQLQGGRQSIEGGGGKPHAGHPTSQSHLMVLQRILPDLPSHN